MSSAPPDEADRRVRRTHRSLREALVTLVLERGWDAVSVRDVCERADVGRSTFYVHFADKENLLLSGFDDLHLAMERVRSGADVAFGFLEPLLEHALENRRVFQALVGRQSAQQIQWRFRDVVRLLVEADLEALKVPPKARKSVTQFIGGGFVESFMQRLDDAHGDSPAKLAGELRKLALGVVAVARPKKK